LITMTMIIFLLVAGIAVADKAVWEKADPFPDEANGGYILRFWSTDGSDRTQALPYSVNIPGANTLEYNIDGLLLLYGLEYSFQCYAYNSSDESGGSNIATYTRDFPSTYTPPSDDLPTHVQIVTPGPVTIEVLTD